MESHDPEHKFVERSLPVISDPTSDPRHSRRDFLALLSSGAAVAATPLDALAGALAPLPEIENPLAFYPGRDWEKAYRDQYAYDRTFT